jgi:nucleoside-diphosphate-sugar epimerase
VIQKTVVVTGSESFIGAALAKGCASSDITIVGIDTISTGKPRHHAIDIRNPEIADVIPQNADALVHLAAISRDRDCRENTGLAFDINVNGTLNLMKAARARGVRQFVFASSEWVYGDIGGIDNVQREDDPIDITRASSEYAITKVVGEQLLRLSEKRGFCAVTVLRFGIVYGPRPKPMTAVEGLLREVAELDVVDINGSASSARRFIYVEDIASGIIASLGQTGFQIFNLSGDRLVSLREVFNQASKLLARSPQLKESDPAAITVRNPDNSRAKSILGWAPRVDIASGLAKLWAARSSPN